MPTHLRHSGDGHVSHIVVLGLASVVIVALVVKIFIVYYDHKEKELFGHLRAPERSLDLSDVRCLND